MSRARRHALALVAVLCLGLAAPAAAGAQAFGPLPQNAPQAPPPPPQPERNNTADDGNVDSQTAFILIGAIVLVLGGIVLYIRRDARQAAPADTRRKQADDIHGHKSSAARHKQERKRQARAKGKAQRAARKKQR